MKDINLFQTKDSIHLKKISTKKEILDNDDCDGYLIESKESIARGIIESLKGKNKILAVVGGEDKFNRRAIETLKINYLVSPEKNESFDTLKQRHSGLNHVLATEAAKRKIGIIINVEEISKLDREKKSLRLEKIIQNIKNCGKKNCDIKIASLAKNKKEILSEKARKSIGISLGMSSKQSKNSVVF